MKWRYSVAQLSRIHLCQWLTLLSIFSILVEHWGWQQGRQHFNINTWMMAPCWRVSSSEEVFSQDGKKRSALSPKTIKRFFLSEPRGRVAEGSASNLTIILHHHSSLTISHPSSFILNHQLSLWIIIHQPSVVTMSLCIIIRHKSSLHLFYFWNIVPCLQLRLIINLMKLSSWYQPRWNTHDLHK